MVNKKIILSVLIIGCIATVAGAGTWAYFEDTKSAAASPITTGTLSLTAEGNGLDQFKLDNIAPGASGDIKTFNLKNAGNVKGQLTAEVTASGDIPKSLKVQLNGNDITKGGTFTIDTVPGGETRQVKISYVFSETGQDQKDEQGKTVTYNILYRLKQVT